MFPLRCLPSIHNIHQGWGQGRLDGPRRRLIEMRRGVYTMEEAWEKEWLASKKNNCWTRFEKGTKQEEHFLIIVSRLCYHKKSWWRKQKVGEQKWYGKQCWQPFFVLRILEQRFNTWDDCNVCQLRSISMILILSCVDVWHVLTTAATAHWKRRLPFVMTWKNARTSGWLPPGKKASNKARQRY